MLLWPGVRPVQELHEVVAVRIVGAPRRLPHHELARLRGLQVLDERRGVELDADADRVDRLAPQLVVLAVDDAAGGRVADDERLAVRHAPVAVGAALVAEAVEQPVGEVGIALVERAVVRIVADHARRDRHLGGHRHAAPDHVDVLVDLVREDDRAPQRDLLLREAADDGIAEVEDRRR